MAGWCDSPWPGDDMSSASAAPRSSEGLAGHGQGGRSVSKCVCSAWEGGKLPGHLSGAAGESQSLCSFQCLFQPCHGINT